MANAFEKRLTLSLGPDVLTPVYSFLSLTEESEYTTSDEEYAETLATEENLEPRHAGVRGEAWASSATRMAKYRKDRLYPMLPVVGGLLLLPDDQAPRSRRPKLVCALASRSAKN